jgi:MYXO-CTERM domain-containing protein
VTLAPSVAAAQAFGFEDDYGPNGLYAPSLTVTSGAQTLTVTPGAPNGLVNVAFPGMALLGTQAVTGLVQGVRPGLAFVPLVFTFLRPVGSITFAFGDAGGDDDTPARIAAFDPSDASLGVWDTPYPRSFWQGKTLSLTFAGAGAKYFVLSSPSLNPNSIYWEVLDSAPAVTTPEPPPAALAAVGLVGLVAVRRARRESR